MTASIKGVAAILASGLAIIGCGSYDQEACERAAESQVLAEQYFGELAEEHAAAHEAGEDHDHIAGLIAGARLEVILAEHETMRSC
ncbi:MAG: hypothetical protein OXF75_00020 [Acidimicrobiaceae bacterium]|nr:hypothetical protein [Acidimicrobiaceae bacterium]